MKIVLYLSFLILVSCSNIITVIPPFLRGSKSSIRLLAV
jgi:hypothetical protein